jgi:tRNA (uracil-5-)-methyltransferase
VRERVVSSLISGGSGSAASGSSASASDYASKGGKGVLFEYPCGSFFQNNNAVLGPLVDYVRAALFPASFSASQAAAAGPAESSLASLPMTDASAVSATLVTSAASPKLPLTHLVDAYCGSGLFALSLAPAFQRVAGIELSPESIAAAMANVRLNPGLFEGELGAPPSLSGDASTTTTSTSTTSMSTPPRARSRSNSTTKPGLRTSSDSHPHADRISFRAGDAADIFAAVPDFPASQTALIIDPPRKGTDERFLRQLVAFGAARVVYVSCNVHTQARDLGMLEGLMREDNERRQWEKAQKAEKVGEGEKSSKGRRYVIESIRGWDLFPQTAHVESVAVLRLEE